MSTGCQSVAARNINKELPLLSRESQTGSPLKGDRRIFSPRNNYDPFDSRPGEYVKPRNKLQRCRMDRKHRQHLTSKMRLVRSYGHLHASRGRPSPGRSRSRLQTNGSSQILRSTKLQSCKRTFVRATSWRTTH